MKHPFLDTINDSTREATMRLYGTMGDFKLYSYGKLSLFDVLTQKSRCQAQRHAPTA